MSMTLELLSESFVQAVANGSKHVVRVEARRRIPASGIVWKEKGLILTANHAVQREERIRVGLPSGESLDAELVGRDPRHDIALLRIEAEMANGAWRTSEKLRVGHLVLALGRPAQDVMATHGIVGALGSSRRKRKPNPSERIIQTDVVMYPGFSGGPLVDAEGLILGMNTSGLLRGISAALSLEMLEPRVTALSQYGYIRKGYLGISLQPVRLSPHGREKLQQETGLLIAAVEEGSPASEAGVLQGDIITSIDDEPLRFPDDLLDHLHIDQIGKRISLGIIRAGQFDSVTLLVGDKS